MEKYNKYLDVLTNEKVLKFPDVLKMMEKASQMLFDASTMIESSFYDKEKIQTEVKKINKDIEKLVSNMKKGLYTI